MGSTPTELNMDLNFISLKFLAIFRNEIMTILTPSTSEGGEWGGGGDHVFRFEGP